MQSASPCCLWNLPLQPWKAPAINAWYTEAINTWLLSLSIALLYIHPFPAWHPIVSFGSWAAFCISQISSHIGNLRKLVSLKCVLQLKIPNQATLCWLAFHSHGPSAGGQGGDLLPGGVSLAELWAYGRNLIFSRWLSGNTLPINYYCLNNREGSAIDLSNIWSTLWGHIPNLI